VNAVLKIGLGFNQKLVSSFPPADVTIASIVDLSKHELPRARSNADDSLHHSLETTT